MNAHNFPSCVRRYVLHVFACLLMVTLTSCAGDPKPGTAPPLEVIQETTDRYGNGGLILSKFNSFDELKNAVRITYGRSQGATGHFPGTRPYVLLQHHCGDRAVTSYLRTGISEMDFVRAWDGGLWERILLAVRSPYTVLNKKDLGRVYAMARRRDQAFGEGDVAFYDIAETMVFNISPSDTVGMTDRDLGEKGYLNTFNHIVAQAFMTTLFSERLADFVADTHERRYTPQLISGEFSEAQMADLENGPTDNYVDMLNNEWGQELGKELKDKYSIGRRTVWTPELLSQYLNDIQKYCSWAFQIGFMPFHDKDDLILKFSRKLNLVMTDAPLVR